MSCSSAPVLISLLLVPLSLSAQVAPPPPDARDRVFYPGDTEPPLPLARKLFGNILLDQKAIWISPIHINRRNAGLWLVFGGITAALIATDNRTSKIFENTPGQVRWGNRISDIGSTYSVAPFAAGFYVLGVLTDNQKARETGVLAGEALLDTAIVVEILKPIAGRNRPNAASEGGHFFEGGASFPSGHTISSWALASVIAHEYKNKKWAPWVAYGLAASVGAARYAARQHYASDVFAGGAMGWFIGTYVYDTHAEHASHIHASIMPMIQPGNGTYGISVKINLAEARSR